jgi:hypothetical protein
MTSLERTACEIVVGLMMLFGFVLYERHEGAKRCENADKTAVAAQVAHNEVIQKSDAQTINQEAIDYAKAIAATPDPVPVLTCVRYYTPAALPKATTAQPAGHAAPELPTAAGPSFDPAPAVAKIGQAADAQIAELQDYVRRVCLAEPAASHPAK